MEPTSAAPGFERRLTDSVATRLGPSRRSGRPHPSPDLATARVEVSLGNFVLAEHLHLAALSYTIVAWYLQTIRRTGPSSPLMLMLGKSGRR